MTPDRIVVTVFGLALIVFIVWFFWLKKSKGTRASLTSSGHQEAMILVKGGYTPDVVVVPVCQMRAGRGAASAGVRSRRTAGSPR